MGELMLLLAPSLPPALSLSPLGDYAPEMIIKGLQREGQRNSVPGSGEKPWIWSLTNKMQNKELEGDNPVIQQTQGEVRNSRSCNTFSLVVKWEGVCYSA